MALAGQIPWRLLIPCLLFGQGIAILTLVPGAPADLPAWRVLRMVGYVTLAGLAVGGWAFFGAWSWRWIMQRRSTDRGRRIFWWGVVGFGGAMCISMTIRGTLDAVGGAPVVSLPFVRELLIQAFIHVPIALWSGWFWGSFMMFSLGGLPAPPMDP